MKVQNGFWAVTIAGVMASIALGQGQGSRELKVHLVQANNQSVYAFLRAKFEPGEVFDPWAVRFFDEKGNEVPYFVWDFVSWKVAREGRVDWGHRYALLNHGSGSAVEVLEARSHKLDWAKKNLPKVGAKLSAQEEAAKKFGDSVCAALYLLRYSVPPYDKAKLTLRIYPKRQVIPEQTQMKGQRVRKKVSVGQGDLEFEGLPDGLRVSWKGRELFRYAGFEAGEAGEPFAHVDPAQPFLLQIVKGIIKKVYIEGRTKGRKGGLMDWQCTYCLFPEGSYVALEGYSLSETEGYLGGEQRLSILEGQGDFKQVHEPLWEAPWWLHQIGEQGFVATHLFYHVPLTIGYGNNPFVVNPEGQGRDPNLDVKGNRMSLWWFYRLDDAAVFRLFAPQLYYKLHGTYRSPQEYGWRWLAGKSDIFLSGKVTNPPEWLPDKGKRFVEEQLRLVKWQPKVDWFYRQYAVGVG